MDSNQAVMLIIKKMRRYQKEGGMDVFQIDEIIDDLMSAYNEENVNRVNKMMEEVTSYMLAINTKGLTINEYVHSNIDGIAQLLNCSRRTVYRKLQNNSFTLIERQMISKRMKEDGWN